jgi:hypothetical protein
MNAGARKAPIRRQPELTGRAAGSDWFGDDSDEIGQINWLYAASEEEGVHQL